MEALLGFEDEIIKLNIDTENRIEKLPSSLLLRCNSNKLVPWLNWEEWIWVKDSLFSSIPQNVSSALKRISTWRSRGCLPVVIDVTASIIEIQQYDPFYRKELPSNALHSEQMLAMLYCMAILRLVNCVVEKTRKKTEISISEAAHAIGIPRTLIDIRHEGSHRDLPSLTLLRGAAAQALIWLSASYWELQTEEIPSQRNETSKIRKEVELKLQELASCLKLKESPNVNTPPLKGKFLKKQTAKALKALIRLYSSFPSEVLSLLLEFLLKALESSSSLKSGNEVDEEMLTLLEDWKLVIVKLSKKEPELLLTLIKAILNMIETEEASKYETGTYLASVEARAGSGKSELLSSLFLWLIRQSKSLKPFQHINIKEKTEPSASAVVVLYPILTEIQRRCLVLSSYGNKQLMDSAVLLAQLIGNITTVEKLTKLSLHGLSNLDVTEESDSIKNFSHLLVQQEKYIHEAVNKLELIKVRLSKHRMLKSNVHFGRGSRWAVAKSWNVCPIGMLPNDIGPSGRIPVLDHHDIDIMSENPLGKTCEEPSSDIHFGNPGVQQSKREATSDICLLDECSVKRMRETVESDVSDGTDGLLPSDIQGCLMMNAAWRKIGEEELLAIKSGVRILV